MKFSERSYQAELLDAEHIPTADLFQNLRELKFINTYLGGHRVVLNGIKAFFYNRNTKSGILEIGSGGGDNLGAIKRKYPFVQLYGVDLKPDCTAFARKEYPDVQFIEADYRAATLQQKPDVIFNSLFCHHFNDSDLVEMLRWMSANSTKGFFIADLHRQPLAYYAIKYLTKWFSKSYLVKNDAPLSVLRGFTKAEWVHLLEAAGIDQYEISWQWAFRHLIVVKHEKS